MQKLAQPNDAQQMTNESHRTNRGQLLSPSLHAQWDRTSSIIVHKTYYLIFGRYLSPSYNRSLKGAIIKKSHQPRVTASCRWPSDQRAVLVPTADWQSRMAHGACHPRPVGRTGSHRVAAGRRGGASVAGCAVVGADAGSRRRRCCGALGCDEPAGGGRAQPGGRRRRRAAV